MSDERDWTQQEFDDLKAAADYEGGWYYAKHADNFPQYSDEKLNGYSGPFASEHEAWVHYMETGEADLNAAHTMLADARAALAERDDRLEKGALPAPAAGPPGVEASRPVADGQRRGGGRG